MVSQVPRALRMDVACVLVTLILSAFKACSLFLGGSQFPTVDVGVDQLLSGSRRLFSFHFFIRNILSVLLGPLLALVSVML